MFQKIVAVALVFFTSQTFAQNLEAILSDTRLPVPVYGMPVVYDGEDSIYVLGGSGPNNNQRDILKFSVTTQTLEKVGTMDPVVYGSAVWTSNGNILHFGGSTATGYQMKVWTYQPDGARNWTHVGDLPRTARYTSSVWGQGEYSYVFGGYDGAYDLNTISRYSSVTNTSIDVGELPTHRRGTTAVWDEATGDAYIFGGYGSGRLNDIVKFNPTEDNVVKLNVTLPEATYYSCAVWTGREAYIIGGSTNTNGQITRFNPSTNQVLNVPVNNLPSNLYSHSCAFVSKLNRIYVFGGVGSNYRDEILYIDLGSNPTSPTTTTPIPITTSTTKRPGNPTDCKNEVCGTRFADPYCCRSFYQCENQEAVFRHCPSQLHFNPSLGECDLPEIVKCGSVDA